MIPANPIAWFYEGQAAYAEAEYWREHCVAIATARLGADHPDTASSLNNLALLNYSLGRYVEAASYMEQALEIFERLLGGDHPSTKTVQQNLEIIRQAME
jgi:tetratricopeptide (TPR) repeat protein